MSMVLSRVMRATWVALASLVICYAVLVAAGRQLLPYLDSYQAEINEFLSRRSGMDVRIRLLGGDWVRFSPHLDIEQLELGTRTVPGREPLPLQHLLPVFSFRADHISVRLDLPRSVFAANLIWEELSIDRAVFTLEEDATGKWVLAGLGDLSADSGDSAGSRRLLEMLTRSKQVRLARAEVTLRFYSGEALELEVLDLLAENSGDFHRLSARLSVAGEEFATALLEGHGDPLDMSRFDGLGYLRLNRVDFSGAPSIVLQGLAPEWAERIGAVDTDVAAELWFKSPKDGALDLVGQISASEIPLVWVENAPPLQNLSADISGWLRPGGDWGLRLQDLEADWGDSEIQPLNLQFSQQLGADWGRLGLAIDHINLAVLNELITKAELLPAGPAELLSALNPRGSLQDLHLDINLENAFPVESIKAHLDAVALDSWYGAPAVKELSGYLLMEGTSGSMILDTGSGFALHFPQVYDNFMKLGSARGRVGFEVIAEGQALTVGGGPIHIEGDAGSIRAAFELYQPLSDEAGVSNMWLTAGVRNSHSRQTAQFIPDILEPTLKSWLDTAIGDTEVEEGGFIWRGPLDGNDGRRRSIQVYARLANGELKFDPHWPGLTQLSAYLSVDGEDLLGRVVSASMGDAHLEDVLFRTISKSGSGLLLGIEAEVQAPLAEAIDILHRSPLHTEVGPLAQWQLGGQVRANLDLVIPLSEDKVGEHYRVKTLISNGRMAHRSADISFEALNGDINYDDRRGLFADGLNATFWGQRLGTKISTEDNGDLVIESAGQMEPETLPIWPVFLQHQVTGSSAYEAVYRIPADGSTTTLKVNSNLIGVTSTLPLPLDKSPEQARMLDLTLGFEESYTELQARLGDMIAAVFQLADGDLIQGDLALGGIDMALPNKPGVMPVASASSLTIRGILDELDIDRWVKLVGTDTNDGSWDLSELNPTFDVRIGDLQVASREFSDLDITGGLESDHWWFYTTGETIGGEVRIPLQDGPLTLKLDYLVLPEPEISEDGESILDTFSPGDFPAVDFSTLGLRIGEDQFGEIAFTMRPKDGGVRFDNIVGEVRGIAVGPTPDGAPASLTWMEIDGQHRTEFSGVLRTFDLAGVLEAWGMPVILNSRKAVFIASLQWADRPWNIDANLLDGSVALNLKKGNFYQDPGATSNTLMRLVGLINFHTWVRRLRLDFSDLFGSGVDYDHLEGSLGFNRGIMAFQPIKVDLPSGKMRLRGTADLVKETIDARMAVTLPVGTNLPWVVALVGGLPAAAGVYLTSRIFSKQVDNISSLSYRISGSWDDPDIQVGKIFSDKIE